MAVKLSKSEIAKQIYRKYILEFQMDKKYIKYLLVMILLKKLKIKI